MISLASSKHCTGCSACFAACTNGAISMVADKNGCKCPVIDGQKCISCHKCEKVCPVLNPWQPFSEITITCFAAKVMDDDIRLDSSSGGVFFLLGATIIKQGGCVFGCVWQKPDIVAVHVKAESLVELADMRRSKYVQSDLKDVFRECKNELKTGGLVLFSGTPCQIAGLNHYLGHKYENLTTVEVICHGTPMPGVFEEYKRQLEKEHNDKLSSFFSRDKHYSWRRSCFAARFQRAAKQILLGDIWENPYGKAFIYNFSLRESCYDCQCKGGRSHADITLGDFWGIENVHSELDDDKGTSAVIVHTTNGLRLWDKITYKMEIKQCMLMDIVRGNTSYYSSVFRPQRHERFVVCYKTRQMAELVDECKLAWYRRLIHFIKVSLFKMFCFNSSK